MTNIIDMKIINEQDHYVLDRFIQPINVIEDWSLCHHLACVVEYIAWAGRKNPILEDLRKAEWYLVRELTPYQDKFHRCHLPLINPTPLSCEAVVEDWELSSNLTHALINIKRSKSHSLRIDSLIRALISLRDEIQVHKGGRV